MTTYGEWNSLESRWPEEETEVLVSTIDGMAVAHWETMRWKGIEERVWGLSEACVECELKSDVTHWMVLPLLEKKQ